MIATILEGQLGPGDRVLDIGTKYGRKFENINENVIEININLKLEVNYLQYAYADGGQLPFKSNSFDYVVCTQVLEHVPHTKKIIEEVSSVLSYDGSFFLNFPNRLFPSQPHSPPGYFSFLPRALATRVAPYIMDESTADYYRDNVYNLSPVRARWLLHQNFDTVEYRTMKHKSESREIFLGEEIVDYYEPSQAGEFVARILPALKIAMRVPPIGGLVELFYPNVEYVCQHPKRTE